MIEQFIGLVTEQLGNQLNQNQEIAGQNIDVNQVAQTTGQTIFETISEQISGGNVNGIMEMFSGQETAQDSPIVNSLSSNLIQNLTNKVNINPAMASTIAAVAIPYIMNMFNQRANEAQSSGLNIQDLISGAMGGNSGGGGMLGNLLGSVLGGGNKSSNMGSQVLTSVLSSFLK